IEIFATLISRLDSIAEFNQTNIEAVFNGILNEKGLKLGKLAQPVRVVLTGGTVSPGIFEVIENLGKDKTIKRLKKAAIFIQTKA
ncbi:MAG: glutamate--tRNA ligase, partial [Deltaproteobacteria bacterium]|nr:glutamate--tRNA ligase [Deltaproteobacteria bacterium]